MSLSKYISLKEALLLRSYFSKINLLNALLLILFNNTIIAQDLLPTESNFGITQEMYSGLNNRDAKAGIEIWAKMIYENYTNIKKSNVIIYENMESLIKSINNNELDIVFLNSLQFIQNKDELKIQPYFGTTVNKEKKYSIYLISKNLD